MRGLYFRSIKITDHFADRWHQRIDPETSIQEMEDELWRLIRLGSLMPHRKGLTYRIGGPWGTAIVLYKVDSRDLVCLTVYRRRWSVQAAV